MNPQNTSLPLANRIGVITGASSGIGKAICLDMLHAGAKLVVNARRAEGLEQLKKETDASADRLQIFSGDAGNSADIEKLLGVAATTFGPVNLAVVNAGRGLNGSLLTSNVAEWEEMIRTNLTGAMLLMRAAALGMKTQREKTPGLAMPMDIVVIGSTVGRHISPFSSAYGSTKFAIHSATEALRREVAPLGIRVTLIEPGLVRSGFQKVAGYQDEWFDQLANRVGPILQPEDIARAATFTVSQPPHVHVCDMLVRPTRQDYP